MFDLGKLLYTWLNLHNLPSSLWNKNDENYVNYHQGNKFFRKMAHISVIEVQGKVFIKVEIGTVETCNSKIKHRHSLRLGFWLKVYSLPYCWGLCSINYINYVSKICSISPILLNLLLLNTKTNQHTSCLHCEISKNLWPA